MTVRLSAIAPPHGLLLPNQCGFLPGLNSSVRNTGLALTHEIRNLPRPKLVVSDLLLDFKVRFGNARASTLIARVMGTHTPGYMVAWVTSFLSDRSCTWVLEGSPSDQGNIDQLERLFTSIAKTGWDIGISSSLCKTELIHWRTPNQRAPHSIAPIELEAQLFHPSWVATWLGSWFTPTLTSTHHFMHMLGLAQAIFPFVKRLSYPRAGVRPFLCHSIAHGLLLCIVTYGADLLPDNFYSPRGMNSISHRVQRWTTNNFLFTPTSIPVLCCEPCLPLIVSYCRYRIGLATLRITSAPPTMNPISARLWSCFPSLSALRAQDSYRHLT